MIFWEMWTSSWTKTCKTGMQNAVFCTSEATFFSAPLGLENLVSVYRSRESMNWTSIRFNYRIFRTAR